MSVLFYYVSLLGSIVSLGVSLFSHAEFNEYLCLEGSSITHPSLSVSPPLSKSYSEITLARFDAC